MINKRVVISSMNDHESKVQSRKADRSKVHSTIVLPLRNNQGTKEETVKIEKSGEGRERS